ncbi:MAG: VOC family protein [Paracoccaceae bacterium]
MSEGKLPEEGAGRPDADMFGRALGPGIGINLLVTDVEASLRFQVEVLGAEGAYWDRDFAIVSAFGSTWMLHHDRTYRSHPLKGIAEGAEGRGAGLEIRLYGCDPDAATARAEMRDDIVLAGPADKPHGLREAYLVDAEGYLWVPSVPKG